MRVLPAALLVFCGGFAIMVLEIIGARYLSKDFGGSFYVWVSQIAMILTALALGYFAGGALADRSPRAHLLAWFLLPAGAFTFFIPAFGGAVVNAIIRRHPLDRGIPLIWQKLDPALGSAFVFLPPCFVLAMLSPFLVRWAARRLTHVGRISGLIHGASTVGGIAGVVVSGYILIDYMTLSNIFRAIGLLTMVLGAACVILDLRLQADSDPEPEPEPGPTPP